MRMILVDFNRKLLGMPWLPPDIKKSMIGRAIIQSSSHNSDRVYPDFNIPEQNY